MSDPTGTARFVAWTFECELRQLEDLLGADFDRSSPTAFLATARFAVELMGCCREDGEPKPDDLFPRLLGHDMHWWSGLYRQFGIAHDEDDQLFAHLGIKAAVVAWIAAEDAWMKQRHLAQRRARKAGRNLLAEKIPKLL